MKKYILILLAIMVLVSCRSRQVPQAPLRAAEETPDVSIHLPAAETDRETVLFELPDAVPSSTAVLELAETDYPEHFPVIEEELAELPVPAADPLQLPIPEEAPAVVEQPPIVPDQQPPIEPEVPEQPPPPAPPPRQEIPPPLPPVTVRPSQPAPPVRQERETPVVEIPDMPFQGTVAILLPAENDLPISRTVRALTGQFIEIPFRGPGWVYLGEFGSRRGVSFDSRRNETEGMTFVFRADTEGTYTLRFNRHDFVNDVILNDYVRVIVEEAPSFTPGTFQRQERVIATPRWPLPEEPQGGQQGSPVSQGISSSPIEDFTPPSDIASRMDTTVPSSQAEPFSQAEPEIIDWIRRAWDEYNAGRIAGALNALNQFMVGYPAGSDEALWLYGQCLEANNESTRDIQRALNYYRRLTNEYPLSSRYDDAQRRINYLERFFFNIQ